MTRVVVDPVTRIEGHLRIEAVVENGVITDAFSAGTMVRGLEKILMGRDPRDAWAITERVCGVCNTVHALTSVRAVENALGIGVHVVRALEQHALPSGVECLDGGTGGFTLLEPLQSAGRILIVDAAADGNPIGTVTRTTPRFSRDYPPTLTAHDIGVKDLLDVFYIQGGGSEVVLYAIAIDPHQPIRMSLSAEGTKAATEAVERILAELGASSSAGKAGDNSR
ncbi:MAG: hydrogenase maturation protease [Terracidiphilus sp.]|jgi:hydrogenase maturation protease